MSAVSVALARLNELLTAADAIAGSYFEAGGENPPMWVHVFYDQIHALQEASSELETALQGDGGGTPP